MPKELATHMNLLLTRDEATVISGLIHLAHQSPEFLFYLQEKNLVEPMKSIVDQTTRKIHTLEWCKDPKCTIKQGKNWHD